MDNISEIKQIHFDYQTLLASLAMYKNPRVKISTLLKSGKVIRVKKGIYILGANYQNNNFSKEVLANLIFGPSYISLEFALSYYQLIPEHVEVITSVTFQRKKTFKTPVGTFSYQHIPLPVYQGGFMTILWGEDNRYLIATKEKALLDKVYCTTGIVSKKILADLLFEDLRIEETDLKSLDINRLQGLAVNMDRKSIFWCVDLIRNL